MTKVSGLGPEGQNAASSAVQCGNCSVKGLCLPSTLEKKDIERLEKTARQKKILHAGDQLYRAGDRFRYLYAIRSGSFKSVVIGANGDTQITHFALPGELLGLDAYSSGSHPGYAEALEESSVCLLPFDQLEELAQQVPALQKQIYSIFSEELRQEHDALLLLGKRAADARLAALLINISSRYARRGYSAAAFSLTMARTDIANYLGLTAETISRLLSKLQKQNIITVQGRAVTILDRKKLSALAGTHCD